MQSRLTEREWQEIEEFRRDWPRFCDADPVAHDFAERMEAAGFIELTAATGREMEEDTFWVEKYGPEPPSEVWTLTPAGRAALAREGK
ncbi:MAG: hypothetical protein ABFE07_02120 [Armatimonadia bacterium]